MERPLQEVLDGLEASYHRGELDQVVYRNRRRWAKNNASEGMVTPPPDWEASASTDQKDAHAAAFPAETEPGAFISGVLKVVGTAILLIGVGANKRTRKTDDC
ncbi:MAG: hypothetical protein AAF170_08420 [Bacteroidota bacterium]